MMALIGRELFPVLHHPTPPGAQTRMRPNALAPRTPTQLTTGGVVCRSVARNALTAFLSCVARVTVGYTGKLRIIVLVMITKPGRKPNTIFREGRRAHRANHAACQHLHEWPADPTPTAGNVVGRIRGVGRSRAAWG